MALEVSQGGRTLYLPEKEEWAEEPRNGPYALGYLSTRVCSGCGERQEYDPKLFQLVALPPTHWRWFPSGWQRCGEWL